MYIIYMTTTRTFSIELDGRTADVTFTSVVDDSAAIHNHDAFACRIGNGLKVYSAAVTAWRVDTLHEGVVRHYRRRGGASRIVTDDAGIEWAINLDSTVVRNRQAHIVGWAVSYIDTATATAHNDYSALR